MATTNWEALDITSIATITDGRSLADVLAKEMADIVGQIDMADARRELGEQIDPIWYARAKSALKHRGRVHQNILQRLGDLNREFRQKDATRLERLFMEAAREILPQGLFSEILDAAHRRARSANGAIPMTASLADIEKR